MQTYDAVVLGLGGMGSAAAYHLARRGRRVLGLDAHLRGHSQGASHGRSRIIREAYFEAPEYVPLVQQAYALWRELEIESGASLLTITGGLNLGHPEGGHILGTMASARQHGLAYELLTAEQVRARFPGFRPTDDLAAVLEPNAGFLRPEECVAAHLDLAAGHGAELHHAEPVRRWAHAGDGVRVETDAGAYQADRLVITAGPWAGDVLGDVAPPLEVRRIVNVHFEPTSPELFGPDRCPIYIWDVPEGAYYGIPALPGEGVKFGRHDIGEVCTPDTIRRGVDVEEIEMLRRVLDRYMPGAAGEVMWSLTCMYTLTQDRHFVLDHHPDDPRVVYGCGFSGHGFKFSSVVGEIMADLAIDGSTRHPVGFLSARRFSAPGS